MGYFTKTETQKKYRKLKKDFEKFKKSYQNLQDRERYRGRIHRPVYFVIAPDAFLLGWVGKLYFEHKFSEREESALSEILAKFNEDIFIKDPDVVKLSRIYQFNYNKIIAKMATIKRYSNIFSEYNWNDDIPRLNKRFYEHTYNQFSDAAKRYFDLVEVKVLGYSVVKIYKLNAYFPDHLLKLKFKKLMSKEIGLLDRDFERTYAEYQKKLESYDYKIPKERFMGRYGSKYATLFRNRSIRRSVNMISKELIKYSNMSEYDLEYEAIIKGIGSGYINKRNASYNT